MQKRISTILVLSLLLILTGVWINSNLIQAEAKATTVAVKLLTGEVVVYGHLFDIYVN